jgi:hypothetical protein
MVQDTDTINPDIYSSKAKSDRDSIVSALDRIRNKVEEWGVVTVSSPVAVMDSTAFYVPDNIVSAKELYDSAAQDIEGTATQETSVGVNNQLGVNATPLIGAPSSPDVSSSATTTTTSTASVSSSNGAELPPIATGSGVGLPTTSGTITVANAVKSIPERLREAEDNVLRQKIYSQMSYPKPLPGFNRIFFAIVQVSCNPGWRTQEHYIADGSASLEYYDTATRRHFPRSTESQPTVFSVLPLIDAQTIEMANSQREVTQLAFQLAASLPAKGVKIDAKELFQFVRQYAKEMRSVTPIPVVNSYSSGGTFGFRFSPSFQAMRNPAQKNSRAANVLLPTAFPALITVVMYEPDCQAVQKYCKEPAILAHVSTRWYLKDRPALWQIGSRLFTPMRRDTAELEMNAAEDIARVYAYKPAFRDAATAGYDDDAFDPMYEEMRREIIALEAKGLGHDCVIPLGNILSMSSETMAEISGSQATLDKAARDAQKAIDFPPKTSGSSGGATSSIDNPSKSCITTFPQGSLNGGTDSLALFDPFGLQVAAEGRHEAPALHPLSGSRRIAQFGSPTNASIEPPLSDNLDLDKESLPKK